MAPRATRSALTERTKQAVAMLRRCADGGMLVDEDGIIQYWNRAAERLLGHRSSEVIGRACHEVLHGETLRGRPLCSPTCSIGRRLACGSGVRNFTIQTRTKGETPVWLPVKSGTKSSRFMAVHLFRDVSREVKLFVSANERRRRPDLPAAAAAQVGSLTTGLPQEAMRLPTVSASLPLTRREREVLRALASGEETTAIAERLCISSSTVRNHVQHILEKMGVHSRLQALAAAFRPTI